MTALSVVMPVYNRAQVVVPAIESVLAQTCAGCTVELIVVDDGSSDDLAGALRPYAGRLTLIHHGSNAGAAAARNTGVAAATGDYVAFIDSDDEWLPGKLARQLEAMKAQGWAASCTAYYLVRLGAAQILSPGLSTGALSQDELVWGCFISPGSTLMFERGLFAEVGPLDTTLGRLEDWDWLLRYARTRSLGFMAEPLARIHVTPYANVTPVLAAIAALRAKHSKVLGARDRRHFEAALDFETAATFYRAGRRGRAALALLKSFARAPLQHRAAAAVLHNLWARP